MKVMLFSANSPSFPLFQREGRLCRRHNQGESIKYEADFAIKFYSTFTEKSRPEMSLLFTSIWYLSF